MPKIAADSVAAHRIEVRQRIFGVVGEVRAAFGLNRAIFEELGTNLASYAR